MRKGRVATGTSINHAFLRGDNATRLHAFPDLPKKYAKSRIMILISCARDTVGL